MQESKIQDQYARAENAGLENAESDIVFKVTDFDTNRNLIYDFLLMINRPTNLPSLPCSLHRFRDIAFDRSKIAIFGYPFCV